LLSKRWDNSQKSAYLNETFDEPGLNSVIFDSHKTSYSPFEQLGLRRPDPNRAKQHFLRPATEIMVIFRNIPEIPEIHILIP
jgi:hypothetical protein